MLQCIMGASTASEVMRVGEAQICFLMLQLELQYVFSHYICIFPHLFLAMWRLSMKPREDLGEGELDFSMLGPRGF